MCVCVKKCPEVEVPEYHWVSGRCCLISALFSLILPTLCMAIHCDVPVGLGYCLDPLAGFSRTSQEQLWGRLLRVPVSAVSCFTVRAWGWGYAWCRHVLLCLVRPRCGSLLPQQPHLPPALLSYTEGRASARQPSVESLGTSRYAV